MSLIDLVRPGALDEAKQGLASFSREANATPGEIIQRLEKWGQVALSVGTPDGTRKGFLAQRLQGLNDLVRELNEWMAEESTYSASMAVQICDAAAMTKRFAMREMNEAIDFAGRMEEVLINWQESEKQIDKSVNRISWILDGWERILTPLGGGLG